MDATNTVRAIKKLNKETYFNFQMRIVDVQGHKRVEIFDTDETYHINYLEDINWHMKEICIEFGSEFKPITEDIVQNELEKAIKKDFGKSAYIDWVDNVTMCVAF